MKNISVNTFVHILFSLALIVSTVTLLLFLSWNRDREKIQEEYNYKLIADAFLSSSQLNLTKSEMEKLYSDFSVTPVDASKLKESIEESGKTIFSGQSLFGIIQIFQMPDTHYIYIQRGGEHLMLQDINKKYYTAYIAVGVGIFLLVLVVLLYIAILKKLSPLKRLYKEIKVFANGDMTKRITYTNRDEIGKIAKSFDDAIIHINELNASKNLFMRNIMHELKTPITKGRIIIESIDDQNIKEILIRAFGRMNELIDELATIERVTTKGFIPNIEQMNISDVIKRSMELLMFESNCEIVSISNDFIQTDIKLLSLAVKNILDNGIKYSKNKKVSIIANKNTIEVISEGEPLKNDLEFYTQPFSQEEKRSGGFGLGLYIVQNIVDKLNYKLKYRHEDGKNIFMIVF